MTRVGKVRVFERDVSSLAWLESQELFADDGVSNDYFGYFVALEGDVLAVTAPGDTNNVSSTSSEQGKLCCVMV